MWLFSVQPSICACFLFSALLVSIVKWSTRHDFCRFYKFSQCRIQVTTARGYIPGLLCAVYYYCTYYLIIFIPDSYTVCACVGVGVGGCGLWVLCLGCSSPGLCNLPKPMDICTIERYLSTHTSQYLQRYRGRGK